MTGSNKMLDISPEARPVIVLRDPPGRLVDAGVVPMVQEVNYNIPVLFWKQRSGIQLVGNFAE